MNVFGPRIRLGATFALIVAVLAACGPSNTLGTLEIVVAGLPAGTDADIAVGITDVTESTSLQLAAGAHQVEAAPVLATASIMGDRLAPDKTEVDVTVTAGQTTTVTITYEVAQQALLLAPNYGDGTITVLTIDDLVAGGEATSAWSTDVDSGYDGLAYGPDGRLYVADYDRGEIVVIDGGDLTSDGTVTPAAVISNAALSGPVGGGFDSAGNLWVGDFNNGTLLRFDGVRGLTGEVDLAPALIVTVDDTGDASAFASVYDVFVDHLDNVWVVDSGGEAIFRFEDVAALTGARSLEPDLYLTHVVSAVSDSGFSLTFPVSLVVDRNGTLFVANYDFEVSRFDDALSLRGAPQIEASAYLDTGIAPNSTSPGNYYMVALDQSGALWVGHFNGELVRLPDPMSYSGNADVSGDLDLELSWLTAAGTGYSDGGTMKFVPTQGPHAGY